MQIIPESIKKHINITNYDLVAICHCKILIIKHEQVRFFAGRVCWMIMIIPNVPL